MPFPFVYVCDLLEDLRHLYNHVMPLLPKDLDQRTTEITLRWLKRHRGLLDATATDDDCVILTLQPEKRTDRIYGLDEWSLENIIARVLNLPKRHCQDLQRWRNGPAQGDLASCVERVMENMAHVKHRLAIKAQACAVTVEMVDEYLLRIASQNKDSSAEVRSLTLGSMQYDTIDTLGELYQRLASREAKWLTRLILKNISPVKFPDSLACRSNHSFLPRCVQVRAQFSSSIPVKLRREGPGSLKLASSLRSVDSLLPTPPATALGSLSPPAGNAICRSDIISPGVNATETAFSSLVMLNRCPQTGKKYRRIALVESRRANDAAEFMRRIESLDLKTPQREKLWVEVYDWRILECVGKVDQGKELTYDPWRRCWIGAV
ncbi:hypothetical protein OIDMADRAFT_146213 [Oidiodendron maius Zn]|uniref:DNA ligase ATP-dependent N-terminal domain-containing protein n=1 Tax=Oidiodendron maius (strain Zn) TaxID=913774 RepID=A0A0C3CKP3_OIDMZ|nr:hypothetical protein OIDMADRAFT_146213 [Oidiodendron maius Zn]